ncbi:MAG TPA: hypothetical protein DCS92_06615, partial [Gammaproteobacteria bacterium]|nr:hypothetical protein [Gammaproteobacteria bacterium]
LAQPLPEVTLTEKFAGRTYTWKGKVVRAEGGVDERNRLLYVVAQVRDPYSADPNQPGRPELVAGSFVEATIDGRRFERVFEVPRKALRNSSQLWVVDENSQLREREVAIIYKGKDSIYISSGLENGDRVVLSQMDIAVDGMTVRTKLEDNYEYEVEPDKNDNIFGSAAKTSTPPAASQNTIIDAKDLNDPRVRQMAEKAREAFEGLDDEQKNQIQESAQGLMQQAQKLQAAITPKAQPKAEIKPEQEAGKQVEMSPLAAQIAADMESQDPPAAEPIPESAPEQPRSVPAVPAQKSNAASPARGGKITISIVSAPEPLVEAVQ